MKKPGGTKVVPELTATLAPIYKKQNDVTKPKDLVKTDRAKLIGIVVLVLILAGAVVGTLFAIGFFGPTKEMLGSSLNDATNNSLAIVNSDSVLPAQLAIAGISSSSFNAEAQQYFKTCISRSIAIEANNVHILSFSDEIGQTRRRARALASAYLLVKFAVLTHTPDVVLTKMQDSNTFLKKLGDELVKKGPFTVMNLLANLYIPPTLSDRGKCVGMDAPLVSAPPTLLVPGSAIRLPLSSQGEILILQAKSNEFLAQYIARSYDGNPWEPSQEAPNIFNCCILWCYSRIPELVGTDGGSGEYYFQKVASASATAVRGSEASISRMLSQSTFGPTRDEIAWLKSSVKNLNGKNAIERELAAFKQWIENQTKQVPSLHRAYFRRRVNPRIFKGLVMPTGSSRAPCAPGTRWKRYAFDESDRTKAILATPITNGGGNIFSLAVEGMVRTVVSDEEFGLIGVLNASGPTRLQICVNQPGNGHYVQEWVGGALKVTNASRESMDQACLNDALSWNAINPAVAFPEVFSPRTLQVFSDDEIKLRNVVASWGTDNDLVLDSKPTITCIAGLDHIQLGNNTGPIYRRDYRLELVQNTLANPAENRASHATMSGTCPSVPATFVNRQSCVMRSSCAPLSYKSSRFKLNRTTLRKMYEQSGKLIYVMEGMRLDAIHSASQCQNRIESSCEPCSMKKSRWKHVPIVTDIECTSVTTLDPNTKATLIAAINASLQTDKNPHVVDIDAKSLKDDGRVCNAAAAFGSSVPFEGRCFTHVHPQYFSVCDATYWNEDHSGNSGKFFPIRAFAEKGGTSLYFPASHPMSRWKDTYWWGGSRRKIWAIGRLDDEVDFADLPVETQDLELAKMFAAVGENTKNAQYMACGSPGEVANDPTLGGKFGINLVYVDSGTNGKFDYYADQHNTEGKRTIMSTLAIRAKDQLRQRVAYALSQIFVISEVGGLDVKRGQQEIWFAFHDILVRHALGSYGDMLKEVAHSPMMGQYLTYLNSKSFASSGLPPDENFAREIMQLFTIGLWKLNLDGSFVTDENGAKIPTYSNKNIQAFARIWTGFQIQNFRGNIEGHRGIQSTNFLDPMRMKQGYHDVLPKLGLDDEYLGDRVQLCADLPSFYFLRKGARFINIGDKPPSEGSPIPGDLDPTTTSYKYGPNQHPQYSPPPPEGIDNPFTSIYKRLAPVPDSPLFQALCDSKDSMCTFPAEVVLDRDLQCHGRECFLDKEIVFVKVIDPAKNVSVFYQFVKPLCVQMAFYPNPKMLGLNHNAERKMCANPRVASAGTVCCMTPNQPGSYFGFDRCEYHLEKVTWEKAVSRCAGIIDDTVDSDPPGTYDLGRYWPWLGGQKTPTRSLAVCKNSGTEDRAGLRALDGCGYNYRASWVDEPCSVMVQVDRYARINVVHSDSTESEVKLDSGNVFNVHWKDGAYPLAKDQCGGENSGCTVHGETCLCGTAVSETVVFQEGDTPTAHEVGKTLKIGSPSIATFSTGKYSLCTTAACKAIVGVSIYIITGTKGWDSNTIFQTSNPTYFLFNRVSNVKVGNGQFLFRNVPHFISLRESSQTDMEAEIQALLDTLLKHDNMAPFIAKRLIQHLVTSNPSPRYIKTVALAFREGSYEGIGTGNYGNLAATVAAILLDREARTPMLDAEPSFGKVREPYLKLMHILRSLEYQSGAQGKKEVVIQALNRIGMAPYESPSVFNFYPFDFQPVGVLQKKGLYAPEMMLGTSPYLLSFLNGVNSLIKYGLKKYDKGLGHHTSVGNGASLRDGDGSRQQNGYLTYQPRVAPTDATAVINELALVLTHGRLDATTRDIVTAAYQAELTNPSPVVVAEGFIMKLHNTDYNCREAHNGDSLVLTLQQTVTVSNGNYGRAVYLRNSKDNSEVKVSRGIRHWAWAGTGLYLNKGPNDPSTDLNCSLIQSSFQPGDILHASELAIQDAPLAALQIAQSLMLSSAEFHTANVNARSTQTRQDPFSISSQNRKYKAIVVVFMNGGADSWNFLVPNSECKHAGEDFDLYGEYANLRAAAALPRGEMLLVNSPNDRARNKQPCTGYGVNPALANIKKLYNDGDAAFIANIGTMVEPLTRDEYEKRKKRYPAALFGHNTQQRTSKSVHAGTAKKPKGILGRIQEALTEQQYPYAAAAYSMHGVQNIFDGKYQPYIIGGSGVETLSDVFKHKQYLKQMLDKESDHGFCEAYSHLLNRSIEESDHLGGILASTTHKPIHFAGASSSIEREMKNVASVILARKDTKNEREVFYVEYGGFDSHFSALRRGTDVYNRVVSVDKAIKQMEEEMKAEGIWDDVLIVSSSDFGRKLVGNGGGTDHAWGGHYFLAGGAVRGGQILGEYPSRLDENCERNIHNSGGRFIPTSSWEALWAPVVEWFGVEAAEIPRILPNKANFPANHFFSKDDIFKK